MDNEIKIDQNIKLKIDYLIQLYLKEIYPYMKFLYMRSGKREDPKSFIYTIQLLQKDLLMVYIQRKAMF